MVNVARPHFEDSAEVDLLGGCVMRVMIHLRWSQDELCLSPLVLTRVYN